MTHVLIVEDNHLTNLELKEHLQDAGFEVETTYCGKSALAAIQRRPPWGLVTDFGLGPGPDGVDVACYAQVIRPGLSVVVVSGQPANHGRLADVAGLVFIAKPYRGEQIVEALRRADHATA